MSDASSTALTPHDTSSASASATDTGPFFAVAIVLCFVGLSAPALAQLGMLAGPPESYMAGAPLAVFSPTIAAVFTARREGGWPAVRTLLRGLRDWRVGPVWYVLALSLPALVYAAGRAVYGLLPSSHAVPWSFLPERPEHFAALLLVPLFEEIGWRGYALPRLVARHGARRATVYLGVMWALWHLPMFLTARFTPPQLLAGLVFIAFGGVMYTWFYRRTGGSLLLAVLLHVGSHLAATTHALPADGTPLYVNTVAIALFAVALLTLDRRAFEGRGPAAPAAVR